MKLTPVRRAMLLAADQFGSERALAQAIGFCQQAVYRARVMGRPSLEMATNIELVTKGKITREILRPDVFGPRDKYKLN